MKYKIGDKVRVRSDLQVDVKYGNDTFVRDMERFAGSVIQINGYTSAGYKIAESTFTWTDEMFEGPFEDAIEHPAHYTQGGIETIDIISNNVADFKSYLEGNILKYISRYRFKNGVEDLKKAEWYLKRLIEELTE